MKKKYIIVCLFLLFFNMKNIYAEDISLEEAVKKNTCTDLIKDGILKRDNPELLFESNYDTNCVYYKNVERFLASDYCMLLQLSFDSETGDYKYDYLAAYTQKSTMSIYRKKEGDWIKHTYDLTDELKDFRGGCPISIQFTDFDGKDGDNLFSFNINGKKPNMTRLYATSIGEDIPSLIIDADKSEVKNCQDILGADGVKILKYIYNIIRIGIPLILLILGSLDFAKVVFSSNEDGIKKAQTKFIKRIVIAVAIFLIPSILHFVLKIAHSIWPVIDTDLCGIL